MSLRDQIINYCRQRPFEYINGGEFERLAMLEWTGEDGYHFKASNASRRLRELEEQGILQSKIENRTVWYKYIPIMQRTKPTPELVTGNTGRLI